MITRQKKRWQWTKRRKNMRALLESDGYAQTWQLVKCATMRAASHGKWAASVTAMALSDDKIELQSVAKRIGHHVPAAQSIPETILR